MIEERIEGLRKKYPFLDIELDAIGQYLIFQYKTIIFQFQTRSNIRLADLDTVTTDEIIKILYYIGLMN